jgi:protein PsiE
MKSSSRKTFVELGQDAISIVEFIGLIVIAMGTVYAMVQDVLTILASGQVGLGDLLLMFLYLEVLLMVRHYLSSGKFPVRYHLYIAIVAIARYLILDLKGMDAIRMLEVSGAVLILAIAVLLIRYGQNRFPAKMDEEAESK